MLLGAVFGILLFVLLKWMYKRLCNRNTGTPDDDFDTASEGDSDSVAATEATKDDSVELEDDDFDTASEDESNFVDAVEAIMEDTVELEDADTPPAEAPKSPSSPPTSPLIEGQKPCIVEPADMPLPPSPDLPSSAPAPPVAPPSPLAKPSEGVNTSSPPASLELAPASPPDVKPSEGIKTIPAPVVPSGPFTFSQRDIKPLRRRFVPGQTGLSCPVQSQAPPVFAEQTSSDTGVKEQTEEEKKMAAILSFQPSPVSGQGRRLTREDL